MNSRQSTRNFVQQTSTANLSTVFWRFQTKQRVVRVNESKLPVKRISMEIILRQNVTMIQIITKKHFFFLIFNFLFFLCFGRFVTRGLVDL